jgi:FkbM family methyltransferase
MMGLRKETVVEFRNGLKFFYIPGLFSVEHFLEQPYGIADVKGRDVIDIGGFNGDSPIFFAWKGARRVYAFEPIPFSYRVAVRNVQLNGIQNIEMFNEAVGLSEGELAIDEDTLYFHATAFRNRKSDKGDRIRVRAFENLVKDIKLKDAVLKMDCEGCEYDILLNIKDELLLPFTQIILEYHFGPDKIVERLTKCGFTIHPLTDLKGRPFQNRPRDFGLLYACRQN